MLLTNLTILLSWFVFSCSIVCSIFCIYGVYVNVHTQFDILCFMFQCICFLFVVFISISFLHTLISSVGPRSFCLFLLTRVRMLWVSDKI